MLGAACGAQAGCPVHGRWACGRATELWREDGRPLGPVLGAPAPLSRVLAAHPAQGGPSASCKLRRKCRALRCAVRSGGLCLSRRLSPDGAGTTRLSLFSSPECSAPGEPTPCPRLAPAAASLPDTHLPLDMATGRQLQVSLARWQAALQSQPARTCPGQAPAAWLAPAWHHCPSPGSFLLCPPMCPWRHGHPAHSLLP